MSSKSRPYEDGLGNVNAALWFSSATSGRAAPDRAGTRGTA
jgi:hypothetical protein